MQVNTVKYRNLRAIETAGWLRRCFGEELKGESFVFERALVEKSKQMHRVVALLLNLLSAEALISSKFGKGLVQFVGDGFVFFLLVNQLVCKNKRTMSNY